MTKPNIKPKKTRLNKAKREILKKFAQSSSYKIQPEYDAAVSAYEKAEKIVFAALEKKFPADEMEILKKHDSTAKVRSARCAANNGMVRGLTILNKSDDGEYYLTHDEEWKYRYRNRKAGKRVDPPRADHDKFNDRYFPLVPRSHAHTSVTLSIPGVNAVDKALRAIDAYKDRLVQIRKDYDTLIQSATYFEDVVAVWPAAETVRSAVCAQSTAITALNNDVIERIQKTNVPDGTDEAPDTKATESTETPATSKSRTKRTATKRKVARKTSKRKAA